MEVCRVILSKVLWGYLELCRVLCRVIQNCLSFGVWRLDDGLYDEG